MKEKFKDIEGYEGLYQISNFGRVKSLPKTWVSGNRGSVRVKPETILKSFFGGRIKEKYLFVDLRNNKKRNLISVHRLVCTAFNPNPENKPEVNHLDGVKTNNNDWNLEWTTRSENQRHAYNTGLINKENLSGENNGNSKLTQQQVNEIRDKYIPYKYSTYKLAKEYGVCSFTIYSIINNKTWKHV